MADALLTALGHPAPQFGGVTGGGTLAFSNFALDASTDRVATIVQVSTADAITGMWFRYGARTGTPPTYRASLQALNASGEPDGTVLGGGSPASVTFTPPADATWDGTGRTVTFANSYTPARGDLIALVIEYSSGTVDGSNNGSISWTPQGTSFNSYLPYPATCAAGTWTKQPRVPNMAYLTASATYGYPLVGRTETAFTASSTPDEYALRFLLPAGWGDTFKVAGVAFDGRSPGAGGSFTITLYSGTTALQSITVDTSDSPAANAGGGRLWQVLFDEATLETLSFGTEYRIGIAAVTTTSCSLAYWTTTSAQDAAAWRGGSAFYLSTRTDAGAWSDDTSARPLMEILLADITEPSGGSGGARIFGSPIFG